MARTDSKARVAPDFSREATLIGVGSAPVSGVDEAGRGPLAGPVVAAAVILDPGVIPQGLNDSKKLSSIRRNALFDQITDCAMVGIGVAGVARIDRDNILQASLWAMAQAVSGLPLVPMMALIDGNKAPHLPCPAQTLVGGDGKSLSIAAASIIAKVTRDRLMENLAADFPGYGWERNRGYGTAEHRSALVRLGVTPHHRRSFAPVRKALTHR